MEPQGQVGHDDGTGLGPAESDLVIGFGVGPWRVQADDRQPLGRGSSKILSPFFDRAPHDHHIDACAGQGVVKVGGDGNVRRRDDPEKPGYAAMSRCIPLASSHSAQARSSQPLPRIKTFIDRVIAPCQFSSIDRQRDALVRPRPASGRIDRLVSCEAIMCHSGFCTNKASTSSRNGPRVRAAGQNVGDRDRECS